MNKRISFGEFDAERIYEWKLALNQGLGKSCCEGCSMIEKRIEKFLGKDAKFLQKQVKKNPYFVNGKRLNKGHKINKNYE